MDVEHVKAFKASLARIEFLEAVQSHRDLSPKEEVERNLLEYLAPAMKSALANEVPQV